MVNQFFQGFQDVSRQSHRPGACASRCSDDGNQLAGTFQGLWSRVDQLKTDLGTEIQTRVTAANGLLDQIADLHRQIQASGGGPAPNDLLDRRDNLVDQLNQIIGVSATDRPDGTVQLAVKGSGVLLVDGVLTAPLTATANVGTDSVDLTAGSVAVTPQGGELAAVMTARNSPTGAIKQATADLDSLARSIISEVNRVHANGAGLTGFSALTSVNAVSASRGRAHGGGAALHAGQWLLHGDRPRCDRRHEVQRHRPGHGGRHDAERHRHRPQRRPGPQREHQRGQARRWRPGAGDTFALHG